jgi:hypothetical protein
MSPPRATLNKLDPKFNKDNIFTTTNDDKHAFNPVSIPHSYPRRYENIKQLGHILQPIHLDIYKKTNTIDRLSIKETKVDEKIDFKPIKKTMTPQLARVDELRNTNI